MPHPHLRQLLLALLIVLLPFTSPAQEESAPATAPATVPEGLAVEDEVVIGKGGTQDLHANIAYPKNASKPLPAIIYIHGGGWNSGTHKQGNVIGLAKAGYFAASIEYRLSYDAKWPAQIQDCKLAVRWLRANAAKYNVDPNRIGVWGASAGGHLAACLGTMTSDPALEGDGGYPGVSSAVQAVVDYCGPTDFTQNTPYADEAKKLTEALFGTPRDLNPALWKSGSPVFSVTAKTPPVFIVHGDQDPLVPLAQSMVFDEALTKAGVPHEFITVKNAGHTFGPTAGAITPTSREIRAATMAFLAKYLKGDKS